MRGEMALGAFDEWCHVVSKGSQLIGNIFIYGKRAALKFKSYDEMRKAGCSCSGVG